MSISRSPVGERPVADSGEAAGKTKGPPDKRLMTAIKDLPLVPEPR